MARTSEGLAPNVPHRTGWAASLGSLWATQTLHNTERHSSLQQCHWWNPRYFFRQSVSHLRGPWITLQDKLPYGSRWPSHVGLLPYLHFVFQLAISSCILACEPSSALASTLLSHPFTLSHHLNATRALPGTILAPDYGPAQFGGHQQSGTIPQEAECMREFSHATCP